MEKDRTRRYGSAGELAADLQRHLSDEPVTAGPPTTAYKITKFVRRNRALVSGLAAVLVVLAAGAVVSTILAIGQMRERMKAESARAEAQAVTGFLTEDLLGLVTAEQGQSPQVRAILDGASQSLEGKFGGQPLVEASIRETLGETYRKLGDYDAAEPHLERAYNIRLKHLGEKDLLALTSMSELGRLYRLQAHYDEAERLLAQALQLRRDVLGSEHPETLKSMVRLGEVKRGGSSVSDYREGARLLTDAFEASGRVLTEDHPVYLEALFGFALLRMNMGRADEALPLCKLGLGRAQNVLGPKHELTVRMTNGTGLCHAWAFDLQEAEPLLKRALQDSQRVLGMDHPATLWCMTCSGIFHVLNLQHQQALDLFAQAEDLSRQKLGEWHTQTLGLKEHSAYVSAMEGRFERAEETLDKAIQEKSRASGRQVAFPHRWAVLRIALFAMQGQGQEMKDWCTQEIEIHREDPRIVANLRRSLAWWQAVYPDPEIRDATAALANATAACELTNWSDAPSIHVLAAAHAEAGDFDKAIECQERALELIEREGSWGIAAEFRWVLRFYESAQPFRSPLMLRWFAELYGQEEYEKIAPHLLQRYEHSRRVFGESHAETQGCIHWLARVYEAWNKPDEAAKWRARLPHSRGHEE